MLLLVQAAALAGCGGTEGDPEGLGPQPSAPQPSTWTGAPHSPADTPDPETPGRPRVVGLTVRVWGFAEELELPRIQPKGQANIRQERPRYRSIRRVGPESLRHFKRTYREALRRSIELSSTRYCPVSAMLSASTTIEHWYRLNDPDATGDAVLVAVTGPGGSRVL